MSPESRSENSLLRLETDKLSREEQEKAFRELRETPENIETGLQELKKLLEVEKDLFVPLTDDEFLLMFLRICKFYPESARDYIKRYYSIRQKYSEITTLLKPSKVKTVFDENLVSLLPQRDQHGRRIIVTLSGKKWNYTTTTADDLLSCGILCTQLLQKEPRSQINGVVHIIDLEGLTLAHALRLTPYRNKRVVDFLEDHAIVRMKGFHIVNQPKIFQPIFAVLKTFFSAKLEKRFFMHGNNYKSLHQHISPECLPKCYGGTLETDLMYARETYDILADHEEFFEGYQKFGLGKKMA